MKVMYCAVIHARLRAYSGIVDAAELGDLMDAIHNIPELVQNWERCDIELLRNSFLGVYEEKWASCGGPPLRKLFDEALTC
jgi:hypothetical protein